MEAAASFLRSPAGQLHVTACERYGVDPGAIASNDYVAFNLRLGAMYLSNKRQRDQAEEAENPALAMERWIESHGR